MPRRKKNFLRRRKKNGRSGKNSNAPARRTGARDLPPDVAEEFGNGKWREIIGNYGKIKMVWGGFGFRICVRKLFAPTPKNEAGFGTVFALPKRFEHILPRTKSAIKCSGKILAKALKRGCGFIFSRNASAAVECGKGKALIIANSIIARFAILAIYIRRTKKSEIFP